MLENSELKKSLDCIHKDQMEKEEKVREEIAEYQVQLQEAEKKHQAQLLDTNKQVKTWGLFPGGAAEWCVDHGNEAFFARSCSAGLCRTVFCLITLPALSSLVTSQVLLYNVSF